MTSSDERVANEMGRALLAIYRAGLQVRMWPDMLHGRARVRLTRVATTHRRRATGPRSVTGTGPSPLAALYSAVQGMNERSGAVVVRLE